jgi:hypothetical protein
MVGVDELEKGLIVEELGVRVVRVWVWKLVASGLACS